MTSPIHKASTFGIWVIFSFALLSMPGVSVLTLTAKQVEPHDFRKHGLDCRNCHAYVSLKTRGVMRKTVGEICHGCHKLQRHTHPVEIKPALHVPSDMPLDMKGMLTCATCHDPHKPYIDNVSGRKTLYLRRSAQGKEFCSSCHRM